MILLLLRLSMCPSSPSQLLLPPAAAWFISFKRANTSSSPRTVMVMLLLWAMIEIERAEGYQMWMEEADLHRHRRIVVCRRVDFYFEFLPAKSRSRFLFWISSRQIDESISILNFFPPNQGASTRGINNGGYSILWVHVVVVLCLRTIAAEMNAKIKIWATEMCKRMKIALCVHLFFT